MKLPGGDDFEAPIPKDFENAVRLATRK
jgi:hypothetical protein